MSDLIWPRPYEMAEPMIEAVPLPAENRSVKGSSLVNRFVPMETCLSTTRRCGSIALIACTTTP